MKSTVKRFICSFLFVVLAGSAVPLKAMQSPDNTPTTPSYHKVTPLDVCVGLLALVGVSIVGWKLSTTVWNWLFKKPIEKKPDSCDVEPEPDKSIVAHPPSDDKQLVPVKEKPISQQPAGFMDSLYNCFFEEPVFDDAVTVTVAGSHCIGREMVLNPDARVVALKVKCQFDRDGGGDASCGYQTVKNFIIVRNGLRNPKQGNLQKSLLDPSIIAVKFGRDGTWRTHVQAQPDERNDGEWVRDINSILNFECEHGNGTFIQPTTDYNFTVIDTIEQVGQRIEPVRSDSGSDEGLLCPITLEVKEGLKTDGDYVHGFAIQTGNQMGAKWDASEKPLGHWKLLVFHKTREGKREYIICDSCNSTRLDDYYAQVIIAVIEQLADNKIDLAKKNLTH